MKKIFLSTLFAIGLIGPVGAQVLYYSYGPNGSIGTVDQTGFKTTYVSNPIQSTSSGSLAFDSLRNLYQSDDQNNYIIKISKEGTPSTYASGGLFQNPSGIAFDSHGNLFVENYNWVNQTSIVKITPQGTASLFATIQGGGSGIAVDKSDNLYVVNYAYGQIYKVDTSGNVSTFASTGISAPTSLAFNTKGELFASFQGWANSPAQILKFESSGNSSSFYNFGPNPNGLGLNNLAFDSNDNLYARYGSNIYKFQNGIISTFATNIPGGGGLTIGSALINSNLLPVSLTSQPTNVSLTATNSQTARFSVAATNGVPPYAYQWMKDGVDLTNETNASLILSNAAANTVGYYSCDVTDQNGTTVTSSNAALNITGVPFYLWQGLVAHYPFNGNVNDVSIFKNNITDVVGISYYNGGLIKHSISFDNTNSYAHCSQINFLSSEITFTSWMIFNKRPDLGMQLVGDGFGDPNLQIEFHNRNLWCTTQKGGSWLIPNYSFVANKWYHITFTYSYGLRQIYLNGNIIAQDSVIPNSLEFHGLVFGIDPFFYQNPPINGHFSGRISDVSIYNRALSSNEVSALFQAESATPTNKQSITFPTIASKAYGTSPFALTATSSAGTNYPITYSSSDSNVATLSSNTVTITGVGTCLITARQPGDFIYKAAPNVSRTLKVTKASQMINFTAPTAQTYGNGSFTLSATASSGLTVSFTSADTNVATVSGNTLTIRGAGSVSITASQAGNANYNAATSVSKTLTVAKAAPTINFNPITPVNYIKGATFPLTATSTSAGSISFASGDTSIVSILGRTATMKAKGTVNVTATAAATTNYNAASTTNSITLQ